MGTWVRRSIALVLVLVIAVTAALALTARPRLNRAQDTVEAAWADVRPALDRRYRALADLAAAAADAPGPERDITADVAQAWRDWRSSPGAGDEIDLANEMEGLARRLGAQILASPTLADDEATQAALSAFLGRRLPGDALTTLNDAIAEYQHVRSSGTTKLVAGLLGFETIGRFDLSQPPPGSAGSSTSTTAAAPSSTTAPGAGSSTSTTTG